MLNSQSSHPLPQNLWWNRTRGCCEYGPYAVFWVSVAGSLPIRKSIYLFGGGIFTSPIRNCLSNCAYVLRASGTDLPQRHRRRAIQRAELRESRDLAHDCQSRELRSHPTHAGVMTICTVPEMDAGCLGHTLIRYRNVIERRDTTPASPSAALTTGVWW